MTTKIECADWMVVMSTGAVGMVVRKPDSDNWVGLRFVNNGPVRRFKANSLRFASEGDVRAAGLNGVGANEPKG